MRLFPGFWQWNFIGTVIGLVSSFPLFLSHYRSFSNQIYFLFSLLISNTFSGSFSITLSVLLYGIIYRFLSDVFDEDSSQIVSSLICFFVFIVLFAFINLLIIYFLSSIGFITTVSGIPVKELLLRHY